jgi:hypothetical protein
MIPISQKHEAHFRDNDKLVFFKKGQPRWITPIALRKAVIAGKTEDWSVLSYNFQTCEPYRIFPQFLCLDCQCDTLEIDEYYMVQNAIWNDVMPDDDDSGMLCIGCLETRLGRILTQADFTNAPINGGTDSFKSPRLEARLDNLVCAAEELTGEDASNDDDLSDGIPQISRPCRRYLCRHQNTS